MFIDQDDYFDSQAFQRVEEATKKYEVEVLIVDATYERPGESNHILQHNFPNQTVMSGDDQILCNSIPWAPWKFIFRRSLVINNNLFFDEKERIEDIDWVHRLVHYAATTIYQPILFIHYQKTDTSTTMTSFKSKETMYSTVRCGLRLCQMVDTVFKCSEAAVRDSIHRIGLFVLYLGMRNYLLCFDAVASKYTQISVSKHFLTAPDSRWLCRMAGAYPGLFSRLSNLTSYVAPALLNLYRRYKYRKGGFAQLSKKD